MYRGKKCWRKWDDCTESVTFYSICSGRKSELFSSLTASFQMKMMNHLNPAKDSPLLSAHEENRHCEKLKWFKDVIPHQHHRHRRHHRLSHLAQFFVLECWYVYKDLHTETHTQTQKNWWTPRGFDCTTVNYERNHPQAFHVLCGVMMTLLLSS